MRSLDKDLTATYSDNPSEAFTVAIAAAIIITLDSVNNLEGKTQVIGAINRTLGWFQRPWRLVSVS
ncbi:hypothetical protein [Rhodopila sp.]|uniref:hypothetical protein n=1 Tax=Rhodopila sp. TaxID=2480087 RepID=UPI003D0EF647